MAETHKQSQTKPDSQKKAEQNNLANIWLKKTKHIVEESKPHKG